MGDVSGGCNTKNVHVRLQVLGANSAPLDANRNLYLIARRGASQFTAVMSPPLIELPRAQSCGSAAELSGDRLERLRKLTHQHCKLENND